MTADANPDSTARPIDGDAIPAIEPFPGLRPFREDEAHLYFGREKHRGEILKRLSATRFVAVVGTSGSGKSSLVRAGMLPDLYCGYLPGAGSDWVVIDMAPGHDPIGRMAAKFTDAGWPVDPNVLRTNSTEILDLAAKHLQPGQHLLVLIDQLEELFRLKTSDDPVADADEKASFVRLFLTAGGQRPSTQGQVHPRVHVVIAMRSEFLGRASTFRRLPEAIDQGQYLIPRLSREQLRRSIECPVRVADGEIEEALVQRLLNELGDDQDQLPVLQHALMRMWHFWTARGRTGKLDDAAYVKCGGFEKALSLDATEALAETTRTMGNRGARIVERVFQALRETDVGGGQTRRPTKVADLLEIAECSREELTTALEPFRRRSFVFPSTATPLDDSVMLDVSHEALLRRWDALKDWIEEDDRDRRLYMRIAYRAADERNAERPDYFAPPLLPVLVKFWQDRRPTRAWAVRHHPEYELAGRFLVASERHQKDLDDADARRTQELIEAQTKRARTKERAWVGALIAVLLLGVGGFLLTRQVVLSRSLAEQKNALSAQLIATKAAGLADANLETRIQLAAESVRREPSLDAQQLLLEALFLTARPVTEIAAGAGPTESVHPVALAAAGDVVYVVTDKDLEAIELASGRKRFAVPLSQISKDSSPLPIAVGQKVLLFRNFASVVDGASGALLHQLGIDVRAVAVNPAGTKVAFLDATRVYLCDLSNDCRTMTSHQFARNFDAEDLAVSPDGESVLVLGDLENKGNVRHHLTLFRTATWEIRRQKPVDELGTIKAIGLDKRHAWVCTETAITRLDAYDDTLDPWDNHRFTSDVAACNHNANRLVTAHQDGTVRVWGDTLNVITTASARVANWSGLALAENRLVTSADRIRVWDIQRFGRLPGTAQALAFVKSGAQTFDGMQLVTLDSGDVTLRPDIGRAPDGTHLLTISDSIAYAVYAPLPGRQPDLIVARLQQGQAPQEQWRIPVESTGAGRQSRVLRPGHQGAVPAVAISRDDRYMTVRVDGVTRIADLRTGAYVLTLEEGAVAHFTATPNEVLVRTAKGATLQPLPEGAPRPLPAGAALGLDVSGAVAFSPDGELIAVAAEPAGTGDQESSGRRTWPVQVLSWPSLASVAELQHPARVSSLGFRGDSRALLSLGIDSAIHVWDLATQRETARIPTPSRSQASVSVSFTPSGQIAISDPSGLTIIPADPGLWVKEACGRITRNLTPEEWSVFLGPRVPHDRTCADRP